MNSEAIRRSWRYVAQIAGRRASSRRALNSFALSSGKSATGSPKQALLSIYQSGNRVSCAHSKYTIRPYVRWVPSTGVRAYTEDRRDGQGDLEQEVSRSNYWGIAPSAHKRDDGSTWQRNCFRPSDAYSPDVSIDLLKHHKPANWEDKLALWTVKALRLPTDLFFRVNPVRDSRKRYGCRAMMLETVAAVPGIVAGMLLHLRSLRKFEFSGWIKAMLEEAENERMHLMTFMEVSQPVWYERALVVTTQGVFFNAHFFFNLLAPRVAHRFVGYLEEEAIYSYTKFLEEIDKGNIENLPAPTIAIDYWRLPKNATLRDVVTVIRADEAHHRDVNHYASDIRKEGKELREKPAPLDYH